MGNFATKFAVAVSIETDCLNVASSAAGFDVDVFFGDDFGDDFMCVVFWVV